jgi:Domain of unknown function (DUF1707)
LIPVLLMLAYPPGYPHAGPTRTAPPRASDADRETTVDILCAAVGDGRLTLAELDERVGAALSARTRAQLAALIADLPGRQRTTPATGLEPGGGGGDRPTDGGDRPPGGDRLRPGQAAARSGAPTPTRWSLIQSLMDQWASPAEDDLRAAFTTAAQG